MEKLHPTQKELFRLLKNNIEEPLTIRELQENLEITSPSVVHHHIKQLEKKGFLKRNPNNPKDYQLVENGEKTIVYLNLYGLAQCGFNGVSLGDNPIDRIPIASRLIKFPSNEAFLVEAKGDSMQPNINEGDLIIARQTNIVDEGEVAVCNYKSTATIKRVFKSDTHYILQSDNSGTPPMMATKDEVRFVGVVKGIIRYS